MYCINISHPDYQRLLQNSGLHPEVLKARISLWMTKNTDERFPTIDELEISKDILKQKENASQARARILKKVNANKEGFVNPQRYKELVDLLAEYNKVNGSPLQLKKAINNNYYVTIIGNSLQQKTSTTLEEKNKELEDKLFTWARANGIAVEAIEDLIQRFEGRYDKGALGVADFAKQLIGLADGRAIDTFAEEVAHFAIRILKNQKDISVTRALENVIYTDEYASVKEEYKDDYSTEEQFREEALGKVLAKELVEQFKTPPVPQGSAFSLYVKAIKDKFIKWVQKTFVKGGKARVQIEETITPLAESILKGEQLTEELDLTLETNDKDILKQKAPEEPLSEEDIAIKQKKEFLEKAVTQLSERMKMLSSTAKSTATIAALQHEIDKIEYNIAKGELDLSIASLVKLAQDEIKQIDNALDKALDTGIVNASLLVMGKHFTDMYSDLFYHFSNQMYEWGMSKEERKDLEALIQGVQASIAAMSPKSLALRKKVSVKTLKEANTDMYGEKIDKDFDEEKVFDKTHTDTSMWRLQVGDYKFADSKLLKAAHKIIFDSIQRIKRFTITTANELLQAQQLMLESGGKIEDLIEKDKDGKPTHYFIREYHWNKYYKALNEHKQQLAESLGFENYNQIKKEFLNKEDKAKFNQMWKTFFTIHTVKVGERTLPNDSYRNNEYTKVMQNPATKAYYDLLIQKKKEAVEKLPIKYRTEKLIYMLPPILKSTVDRLANPNESWNTKIGNLVKESLLLDPDDTQFGQINVLNNKMVPIHFTKALDNTNDLSYDVARTITLFSEMAENFKEMNKIAGELGVIQLQLAEKTYVKKKEEIKGIQSNDYKALSILLDTHVFGIERSSITSNIPTNWLTEKIGIAGKEFSWVKASQKLTGFIRDNNLALNIVTSTSGWLKGSGDSIIEDAIGIYTTTESKNWARVEFFKNIGSVVGEIGKSKQTNKMHLILQQANIFEIDKLLYNTQRGRASRKLLNKDILYTTFATGDYGIKGRVTLAVYDNYRLSNGKFTTRARFLEQKTKEGLTQKEAQKEWESLRDQSLYNAHEVVDGQLKIKDEFKKYVTEGVLNAARGKVEQVTHAVDGTLSATDKGALSRTMAGDFLLMHRGWFIGMIDTRLRKEGTNMITGEEEIGTYRASLDFIWNSFGRTLVEEKGNLMAAFASWHTLTPARKRGVLKSAYDLIFLNIVALIAAIANTAADATDDEDWTTQYLAYQMNRLLLEQSSAWSLKDLVEIMDEPVVGARMIKELLDISEAWNTDTYERGMYADKMHMTKWWMRKLPTKNLYELQYPDLKNNFMKQMVDSKYYDWMSPEQVNSLTTLERAKGLFDDADSFQKPDIPASVRELQEETEEYNGFN